MWLLIEVQTIQQLQKRNEFDNWSKRVWWFIALKTWILNWWKLSTLRNTNAELIEILLDRSFASSEFTEYFIIERFYLSFKSLMTKSLTSLLTSLFQLWKSNLINSKKISKRNWKLNSSTKSTFFKKQSHRKSSKIFYSNCLHRIKVLKVFTIIRIFRFKISTTNRMFATK